MLSETEVRALVRDKRLAPPVLSLYLNTDRAHPEGEKYLAAFRQQVHEADRLLARRPDAASRAGREQLTAALSKLLALLDERIAPDQMVRGVAIFVSLGASSTHDEPAAVTFTLPRPVRSQAHIERRPYARPLLYLLDQYERVGAIVADRTHARIFTFFLGEPEVTLHRTADTPQRHTQGGWKQMLFQRDVDGHVSAHVRSTVRAALRTFHARPLKRLVLGGTDETLSLLRRALPARFRELIAGTFHTEAHASDHELVTTALSLAQQAEHVEEARRVDELRDALSGRPGSSWGGPRRAVTGLADTLTALAEQRVQRLVVRRGYRAPGGSCENCGALFAGVDRSSCDTCTAGVSPVSDVVESAVEHAYDQHADVEFVTESPTLEAFGHIGALLRF